MTQPYKKCPKCDTPADLQAIECRLCGHVYRQSFTPPSMNRTQFVGFSGKPMDTAPIVVPDSPRKDPGTIRIVAIVIGGICALILCMALLLVIVSALVFRPAQPQVIHVVLPENRLISEGPSETPSEPDPPLPAMAESEHRPSDIQFGNHPPVTNPGMPSAYPGIPGARSVSPSQYYSAVRTGPAVRPQPLPRPYVINHGPERDTTGGFPGGGAGFAGGNPMSGSRSTDAPPSGWTRPDGLIESGGAPVGRRPRPQGLGGLDGAGLP